MGRQMNYLSKSEKIVWMSLRGMKPKQIAKELGMSVGSVRVLLWKRKRKTSRLTARNVEFVAISVSEEVKR